VKGCRNLYLIYAYEIVTLEVNFCGYKSHSVNFPFFNNRHCLVMVSGNLDIDIALFVMNYGWIVDFWITSISMTSPTTTHISTFSSDSEFCDVTAHLFEDKHFTELCHCLA